MSNNAEPRTHEILQTKQTKRLWWWICGFTCLMVFACLYAGRELAGRVTGESGLLLAAMSQAVLLAVAAIVAAWYAHETRLMAGGTMRLAEEAVQARRLSLQARVTLEQDLDDGEPKRDVYARNRGPGMASKVVVWWDGEFEQPLADQLAPGEDSRHHTPCSRYKRAVLTYESVLREECRRHYDKDVHGWWRPVRRPPDAS